MHKNGKSSKTAAKSWLAKAWPEGAAAHAHLKETLAKDAVLDAKTRGLIQLACVSLLRCRHCVDANLTRLKKEIGASDREIAETMLVASMSAAGTNIAWAKEVFQEHLG